MSSSFCARAFVSPDAIMTNDLATISLCFNPAPTPPPPKKRMGTSTSASARATKIATEYVRQKGARRAEVSLLAMEDATRIASALQQAILSRRIRAPTFTSDATAFAAGDRQGGFWSSGAAGVQGARDGSGGGGGSAVSSSKCSRALDVEKCLHLWKQKNP